MMTANLYFKCPAENTVAGASPDLNEANSVKCSVCSPQVSDDKYPEAGKIWYTITFGPLFDESSASKEDLVTSYSIVALDQYQRPIDAPGMKVTAVKAAVSGTYSTSCCQSDLHMIKAVGIMPAEMKRLMLVPVKDGVKLPSGYITGELTDSKTGAAKENNGTITLKFADAAAATAAYNSGVIEVLFIKAMAETISGIGEDDVHVVSAAIGSRRLMEATERRLSTSHIIVEYIILSADKELTVSDIDPATLLDAFKRAATALGVSGDAASAIANSIAPSVGEISTSSVGIPVGTSLAVPSASSMFSFVLAAAMTLATVFH